MRVCMRAAATAAAGLFREIPCVTPKHLILAFTIFCFGSQIEPAAASDPSRGSDESGENVYFHFINHKNINFLLYCVSVVCSVAANVLAPALHHMHGPSSRKKANSHRNGKPKADARRRRESKIVLKATRAEAREEEAKKLPSLLLLSILASELACPPPPPPPYSEARSAHKKGKQKRNAVRLCQFVRS